MSLAGKHFYPDEEQQSIHLRMRLTHLTLAAMLTLDLSLRLLEQSAVTFPLYILKRSHYYSRTN